MEREVFPWEKVQKHHDRSWATFLYFEGREARPSAQAQLKSRGGGITVDPGAPRRTSSKPTAFPAPPPLRNPATSGGTAEGSSRAPRRASARDASSRATSTSTPNGAVAPGAEEAEDGAAPGADDADADARTAALSVGAAARCSRNAPRWRRRGKEMAEWAGEVAGGERRWCCGRSMNDVSVLIFLLITSARLQFLPAASPISSGIHLPWFDWAGLSELLGFEITTDSAASAIDVSLEEAEIWVETAKSMLISIAVSEKVLRTKRDRDRYGRACGTVDPGAPRRTSSEPTAFPAPPLRNSATSGGTAEGSSRAPSRASARDASSRATSRCATSTITSDFVAPGAAADDARTALDALPPSGAPAPRRRRRRGRRRGARVGKETAEDGELVAGGGERSWSIGSRRGVRRVDERSER
uniref:Uncharacterized protein n=1 Tax=Oryza meridionalis TaxID=40149 RepID=A0A0E0EX88_9ORYZ